MSPRIASALALIMVFAATSAIAGPVVVIDPGHGGHKPGTKTKAGVPEKTIVLGVARHTKRYLEERGYRVVMTRAGDAHVELERRASLANKVGAVAFVSIHANFAPVDDRHGCETYVLSAEASDETAAALLHLEEEGESAGRFLNEESFGGGAQDREQGDLDFILADLERAVAHRESARLAKKIQDRLGKVRGLAPSRGLRQAPFMVLRQSRMASVLVEVGYLSHTRQGAYLASARGQAATGNAIGRGIDGYLASLNERR